MKLLQELMEAANSKFSEKINVNQNGNGWVATLDSYDGAPDADYHCKGHGKTVEAALKELEADVLEHHEEFSEASIRAAFAAKIQSATKK